MEKVPQVDRIIIDITNMSPQLKREKYMLIQINFVTLILQNHIFQERRQKNSDQMNS